MDAKEMGGTLTILIRITWRLAVPDEVQAVQLAEPFVGFISVSVCAFHDEDLHAMTPHLDY